MFNLEKTILKFKREIYEDLKDENNDKYFPFEAASALLYLDKVLDEYYSSLTEEEKSSDYIITGKEV